MTIFKENQNQNGQLNLTELAVNQAERLLDSAELKGLPETKHPTWLVHRGAYTAGMISGVQLGYAIATKLAQKAEQSANPSEPARAADDSNGA